MRTVAIVQVRLASTRYPHKALADLGGRPVLAHVVERALAIRRVDRVVVNCPGEDAHVIAPALMQAGINCTTFPSNHRSALWARQHPPDVLASYAECAAHYQADIVMRVTGDCPLLCPFTAASVLWSVREGMAEFGSNDTTCSGYPDGLDVEVFTRDLLERAHLNAIDPYDREHVSPWMRRDVGAAAHLQTWTPTMRDVKLSIDTKSDLDRVRAVQAAIQPMSFHVSATLAAARKVGEWP